MREGRRTRDTTRHEDDSTRRKGERTGGCAVSRKKNVLPSNYENLSRRRDADTNLCVLGSNKGEHYHNHGERRNR